MPRKKWSTTLLVTIYAQFAGYCSGDSGAADHAVSASARQDKLLNVFNIIKFPNDGCETVSGTYGVCYTASECDSLGGAASGNCASGFGVCCLFTGTCGGTTSFNNTYFKSTGSDSSTCTFKVCKASTDICQLRLNFDTFVASQPSTIQPGDTSYNGRTQCLKSNFRVTSDGPPAPVICGTNTGEHMIVEASDDCNEITFDWASSVEQPEWNIQIMQIACSAWWKPQDGCFQYYTGTTGYVKSFNYDQGVHLANQQYTACIRQEMGYCSIEWTTVSTTGFQISGPAPGTAAGVTADDCSQDYVIIYSGASSLTENTRYDRWCGGLLADPSPSTTAITVYSDKLPFQLLVSFDGTERDNPSTTYENSKGFYLYYSQTSC